MPLFRVGNFRAVAFVLRAMDQPCGVTWAGFVDFVFCPLLKLLGESAWWTALIIWKSRYLPLGIGGSQDEK